MLIKTRLIQIGNSRGFRIPKAILDEAGLTDEVTIEVQADSLIIRPIHPAHSPRQGWEDAARQMVASGDDRVWADDGTSLSTWDKDEWEW